MNPPEITPKSLIETNLYFKSLKYVSNYQKTHPEKMREKNKNQYNKTKTSNPEKYEALKKKSLDNYYTIRKPKLEEAKRQYLLLKSQETINQ
jgi:hypothetical protein